MSTHLMRKTPLYINPPASWDSLPPELVARILAMCADAMREDAKQRRMQAIIASVWERVWRAKLRVIRHRLPPIESHGLQSLS
jgi:hypothetical protein